MPGVVAGLTIWLGISVAPPRAELDIALLERFRGEVGGGRRKEILDCTYRLNGRVRNKVTNGCYPSVGEILRMRLGASPTQRKSHVARREIPFDPT